MRGYFRAISEVVAESSPGEVVGGLLIGLVLALAASGLWVLGRKKVSDPFPMICGLFLIVSALSMGFGAGHARYGLDRAGQVRGVVGLHHPRGPRVPAPVGRRLLLDADADGDGRLTPEEAARFVKEVDREGKGWADAGDLDRAFGASAGAARNQEFHPDANSSPPRREGY